MLNERRDVCAARSCRWEITVQGFPNATHVSPILLREHDALSTEMTPEVCYNSYLYLKCVHVSALCQWLLN